MNALRKPFTALFIFLLIAFNSSAQNTKEANKVRKAFNNYKQAILQADGKKALKYVDCKTITYYNNMLEKARNADSVTVSNLPVLDKFMVLSIRQRATKEQIISFAGKDLFIYAINQGMIGKNSVKNGKIGKVVIKNNFAKGQFITEGKTTELYLHFYKEGKRWKVDLTSVFDISAKAFKRLIELSEKPENGYLISLIVLTSGKQSKTNIWQPIAK